MGFLLKVINNRGKSGGWIFNRENQAARWHFPIAFRHQHGTSPRSGELRRVAEVP